MEKETLTLDEKFWKYHEENPHVYKLLLKYTYEVKGAGFKNYSLKAIVERIRWHTTIETNDPDGFKMSNSNSSRYARLLMKEHPDLEGFFRINKLTTFSVLATKRLRVRVRRRENED